MLGRRVVGDIWLGSLGEMERRGWIAHLKWIVVNEIQVVDDTHFTAAALLPICLPVFSYVLDKVICKAWMRWDAVAAAERVYTIPLLE